MACSTAALQYAMQMTWRKRGLSTLLTIAAGSDVENVPQEREANTPRVTVAGVDRRGTLVDANDGSDLSLQVLVFERDLLTATEVTAPGPDLRRGSGYRW